MTYIILLGFEFLVYSKCERHSRESLRFNHEETPRHETISSGTVLKIASRRHTIVTLCPNHAALSRTGGAGAEKFGGSRRQNRKFLRYFLRASERGGIAHFVSHDIDDWFSRLLTRYDTRRAVTSRAAQTRRKKVLRLKKSGREKKEKGEQPRRRRREGEEERSKRRMSER